MVAFKRNWSLICLLAILLIAGFFRLYRVRDYLVFLGDEGRDALVWKRMIVDHKFTLLGPTASVGGFYLGPVYYYLTLPFAYALNLDPVGPAYFVSILGIATVYLVYLFGRRYLNKTIGLIAAFLYSFAPLIVRYSRSSWNPNPLPFFTLAGLMLVYEGVKQKKLWLSFLAGIGLGIAWQLHYLALILAPIYLAVVLIESKKFNLAFIIRHLLFIFLGWIIGFLPFLAFEIRHGFPNTRTIFEFITRPYGAIHPQIADVFITGIKRTGFMFATVLMLPDNLWLRLLAAASTLATVVWLLPRQKLLLIWYGVGMFVFAFYNTGIADYYFGFLFPVPFLMIAILLYRLWRRFGWPVFIAGLLLLSYHQLSKAFFWNKPNRQVNQTETIADVVIAFSQDKPFNFALIAGGNSDHAYRFFLEFKDRRPLGLEEQVTDQLIIVCEKPQTECQPLGNSLWEIAGFGRSEVNSQTTVNPGITIYRMTHYYD
jgi:4-amino-4-deoxy-L-arabinose transferase-like glycosyltransferase